jgi:sugar lactone lactonase YvrE
MKIQLTLILCALSLPPAARADDDARHLGDARVVARTPPFPEGAAVRKHIAYVSQPAIFGTAGSPPSTVTAIDLRTSAVVRTLTIQGEQTQFEHALSGEAFDGDGNLYVISTQLGVLRLDPDGDRPQQVYAATLPVLPPCPAPAPCKPTQGPPIALPNDLVFDEIGNLYITDSLQATIWMVPPGGGQPQIWFQDARLGGPFGPNGIRLDPERRKVYFNVTTDGTFQGVVYTLPLVAHPQSSDLQVFHTYPAEGPDDLAFGRSGKLYVSLAGSSQISVLGPDGTELARYSGPASCSTCAAPMPLDGPANIAFDDARRSIVFTNHASVSRNPDHFALIEMFVDDRGDPLERPELEQR